MDLRKKAVADSAFLHLRDADEALMYAPKVDAEGNETDEDDETRPVGITMYGPGSKKWQAAQAAKTNRTVARLKAKGKTDMSAEESARETATFLADVTVEFHEIERDELTGRDLHVAVYQDKSIGFIAEQAHAWTHEWANFSKGSRTS